jgi:hypothetical protein
VILLRKASVVLNILNNLYHSGFAEYFYRYIFVGTIIILLLLFADNS